MASGKAGAGAGAAGEDEYLRAVQHLGGDDGDNVNMEAALAEFWAEEIENQTAALQSGNWQASNDLPLARIKRIMKSDEDVRMIAAEAPVLFAKACELFITELAIRSYCYADGTGGGAAKRRTVTRVDVCTAVQKTDIFDFLVGVLTPGQKPQYQLDLEAGLLPNSSGAAGGSSSGHAQPYPMVPFAKGPRPMPAGLLTAQPGPQSSSASSSAAAAATTIPPPPTLSSTAMPSSSAAGSGHVPQGAAAGTRGKR